MTTNSSLYLNSIKHSQNLWRNSKECKMFKKISYLKTREMRLRILTQDLSPSKEKGTWQVLMNLLTMNHKEIPTKENRSLTPEARNQSTSVSSQRFSMISLTRNTTNQSPKEARVKLLMVQIKVASLKKRKKIFKISLTNRSKEIRERNKKMVQA